LKGQDFGGLPFMPDLRAIAEQNNVALERVFKGRIKGRFLIDIKDQVIKDLGLESLLKYYDFRWSDERMITGIGEAAEYDICRMIVGIHRAHSIFLSDDEIRKNERSRRYRQGLVSETIEKIRLRFYGSVYFRKNILLPGEEFLYYPLPYEIFAMLSKMSEMLMDGDIIHCGQLYYGVVYNGLSALSLLEGNLYGTAYPLCRGAIEMYVKLLILNERTDYYEWYEKFRMFEVEYSCSRSYPGEFDVLFEKRSRQDSKARADYLHFGWVDFIDGYHKTVKKFPYSISGIVVFLKNKNESRIMELERLEDFYRSCHAYTHGSIQTAKYPVLHYFEISIMLYYVIRDTFLLICREKGTEALVNGEDIVSMIDRDFEVLYGQYKIRSTDMFERYYALGLPEK
jgi:hypothetical protein